MLLSQDQVVVEALKRILEDYVYLKYDETHSNDKLYVKQIGTSTNNDVWVPYDICEELGRVTGRKFVTFPFRLVRGWTHFYIQDRTCLDQKLSHNYH